MKIINFKKPLLIFFLVILGLICIYFSVKTHDLPLNIIQGKRLTEIEPSGYKLTPLSVSKSDGSVVNYPTINYSYKFPYSIQYLVSNSRRNNGNNLNKANKIIAETETWSDQLSVIRNQQLATIGQTPVTDYQLLITNLLRWWQNEEPKPYEIWKVKTYGSWEAMLARYYRLINKEIDKYDDQNNNLAISTLIKIRQNVYQNQQKINYTLLGLAELSSENRNHLQKLVDAVFNQLNQQIDSNLPQSDLSSLIYLPVEAINQNDNGQYDVYLSGDLGCYQYENDSLSITAKPLTTQDELLNCSRDSLNKSIDGQTMALKTINLAGPGDYIVLKYQPKNLINPLLWSDENGLLIGKETLNEQRAGADMGESETKTYSYYQNLPLESTNKYYFTDHLQTEKPSVLEIRLGESLLFSHVLSEKVDSLQDQLVNLPADNGTASAVIKLIVPEGIDPTEAEIRLAPIYEPTLFINKSKQQKNIPEVIISRLGRNRYLVNISNLSETGIKQVLGSAGFGWKSRLSSAPDLNSKVYLISNLFPSLLFVLGSLCLLIALLIIANIKYQTRFNPARYQILRRLKFTYKLLSRPFGLIGKLIYRTCIFLRIPLLLVALASILYDVFFLKGINGSVITFIWLTWFGAIIGWRLEGRFSYLLSLVFLIFCPLFLAGNNDGAAEKSALWFYIFLVTGIATELLNLKNNKNLIRIGDIVFWIKHKWLRLYKMYREQGLQPTLNYVGLVIGHWFIQRKKETLLYLDRLESRADKSVWYAWLKYIIRAIRYLVILLDRLWYGLILCVLSVVLYLKVAGEINFYYYFFEEACWGQALVRFVSTLTVLWLVIFFIIAFVSYFRKHLRRILVVSGMVGIIILTEIVFNSARSKFEFKPYVVRLKPGIADTWTEVEIIGRNFNNLPFKGKVMINGREQRVVQWGDQLITFVVDPSVTSTGNLVVINDYGSVKGITSNSVKFTYFDWNSATQEERDLYWKAIMEKARLKGVTGE